MITNKYFFILKFLLMLHIQVLWVQFWETNIKLKRTEGLNRRHLTATMGDWHTEIVKSATKNKQGKRLVITTRKFLFCDVLWDEIKTYLRTDVLEHNIRKQSLRFLGEFLSYACNKRVANLTNSGIDVTKRKDYAVRVIMKYHYHKKSVLDEYKRLEPKPKEPKVLDWSGHDIGKMVRTNTERTRADGSRAYGYSYGRIIKNTGKSVTIEYYDHLVQDQHFRQNQTLGNAVVILLPFQREKIIIKRPLSPYDIHHNETIYNMWSEHVDYGN